MIAVDTSVVVAAFAAWHEAHDAALAALGRRPQLPAHAALESFSVITRLPPPHRAGAGLVAEFLTRWFPRPYLTLSGKAHRQLLGAAVESGIRGGAIYDALIAAAAREAGATLLSRDGRAAATYALVGASYELLS